MFQACQMTANEQRKRYEELELIVKTFSDKENLGRLVKLLQQKREWANVSELKEQYQVNIFFHGTFHNIFKLGLATLLEGVGLAFDIQKCSNFQKSIMFFLKL